MATIDLGLILRWGDLITGLCIFVVGILKTLTFFNTGGTFLLAYFTYSLSTILFGLLIAQTFHPIESLVRWFPFTIPWGSRGCFMIYVGFGSFGGADFGFEDVVAIFTIIFGFMHLILSCTGSVREEGQTQGQQTVTRTTKTTTMKRTSGAKGGSSARMGGRV